MRLVGSPSCADDRRARRAARAVLASVLGAALALGVAGGSGILLAAPASSAPPSDDDVRGAQREEARAERSVAAVETDLVALRARQEDARSAVQSTAEEYAAARSAVDAADAEVDDARAAVTEAEDRETEARAALGALYRATRQGSTGLETAEALLDADEVTEVVERETVERAAGRTVSIAVTEHTTARAVADTARARAAAALDHQADVEAAARTALAAAQAASAGLDREVASSAADRESLLAELARARETTVAVERERQDAIDVQAARTEEERARARIEATVGDQADDAPSGSGGTDAGASAPTRPESRDDATDRAADASGTDRPAADPPPRPDPPRTPPAPSPSPRPEPDPPAEVPVPEAPPGTSVGSASQGTAAVAWARSKIGAPYVFGGTGPGYDCSGLTSRAWASTGVDITRTSRSQYQRVQKIAYDRLRPGDLIFYANDTSDPTTIRHVAIYAGGGRMVEAPQPGVAVREVAVRWTDAMPYAGRP